MCDVNDEVGIYTMKEARGTEYTMNVNVLTPITKSSFTAELLLAMDSIDHGFDDPNAWAPP